MTKETLLAHVMIDITEEHGWRFAKWLLYKLEEGYENHAKWIAINRDDEPHCDDMSTQAFIERLISACNDLKFDDAIKGYTLIYDDEPRFMIRL